MRIHKKFTKCIRPYIVCRIDAILPTNCVTTVVKLKHLVRMRHQKGTSVIGPKNLLLGKQRVQWAFIVMASLI